jgi:hypothetical protein
MWIHPSRGLYKLYTYTQQLCDDGKDSPLYTATCDLCPVCVIRARCDTTDAICCGYSTLATETLPYIYMYIVFFSSSSTSSIFLSSVVVDDCTCKKKKVETYIPPDSCIHFYLSLLLLLRLFAHCGRDPVDATRI